MKAPFNISEALLHQNATAQALQQGEELYRSGAVTSLVRCGDTLHAEVEGSEGIPYRVAMTFEQEYDTQTVDVLCSCLYDYGGWCLHVVATALKFMRASDTVKERLPLPELIRQLNNDQRQALLLKVAERHPGLTDEMAVQAYRLLAAQPYVQD